MPFTPLHLGPALVLGYFLKSRVHWPTLIIASVIVDLEPLAVFLFGLSSYPIHGYLHTFVSAVLLGSLVGVVMWLLKNNFSGLFKVLALTTKTGYSLSSYVVAGFSGWALHVLLDSPLYSDIKPLYPLNMNPLYYPSLSEAIISICFYLTLAGVIVYLVHFYRTQSRL